VRTGCAVGGKRRGVQSTWVWAWTCLVGERRQADRQDEEKGQGRMEARSVWTGLDWTGPTQHACTQLHTGCMGTMTGTVWPRFLYTVVDIVGGTNLTRQETGKTVQDKDWVEIWPQKGCAN